MEGRREISLFSAPARLGLRAALDFLFPPLCVSCRARVAEPHALCSACWSAISFTEGAICARCGIPFEVDPGADFIFGPCHAHPRDFAVARALFRYDDASKRLILAFKHGDRLEHAPAFAHWLERTGRPLLAEADLIVPVPLHRFRLWRRRYNQSAVMAAKLAQLSGRAFDPLALERKRPTRSQGEMPSAKARRRNVLGAFRVPPQKLAGIRHRNVLVVDDVYHRRNARCLCPGAQARG